jgi:hypothetical protein
MNFFFISNPYASSSCFILSYSSFVNALSLSLNFCNFARDESKSGRGGGGGILEKK